MKRMYYENIVSLVEKHQHFSNLFFQRIIQLSANDFILEFTKGHNLFFSLNASYPFIAFDVDYSNYPSSQKPSRFGVSLKQHLSGRLKGFEVIKNDTVLALHFVRRNNVLDEEKISLFLELIPRHPLAVLVTNTNTILAASQYRKEQNIQARDIKAGVEYLLPKNSENIGKKTIKNYDYFNEYLQENHSRIKKENYAELYLYLAQNIKRLERLISNYKLDLKSVENVAHLYEQANLLLSEKPPIKGENVVINGVNIKVDPRFSALQNADIIFKHAKKIKRSEHILLENIAHSQALLKTLKATFDSLESINNGEEIMALYKEFGLSEKKGKSKEVSKNNPSYIFFKNTRILFGKNSQQNDYLTFTIANKKETFLHIKNSPGSHVIIQSEKVNKELLEFAGMLILFLAKRGEAEITYSRVSNLKKGPFPGAVILRREETFFIRYDDKYDQIFKNNIKRL